MSSSSNNDALMHLVSYYEKPKTRIFGPSKHISNMNLPKWKPHHLNEDEKDFIQFIIDFLNEHADKDYSMRSLEMVERYSSLRDSTLEIIVTFYTDEDFEKDVYTFDISESSCNTLKVVCVCAEDEVFDRDEYLEDANH